MKYELEENLLYIDLFSSLSSSQMQEARDRGGRGEVCEQRQPRQADSPAHRQ